jgi:hypothetical protein
VGLLLLRRHFRDVLDSHRYFKDNRKPLLEVDFEGIMKIMKNVSDYVADEEVLVSYIYDVSFPKWVYDEIPKLESEFLK